MNVYYLQLVIKVLTMVVRTFSNNANLIHRYFLVKPVVVYPFKRLFSGLFNSKSMEVKETVKFHAMESVVS